MVEEEKIEFMFPAFLKQRCWSTPAPLYRRLVTDAAGPWENLRQEEDWEYDCRIGARGIRLHYVDEFIAEIGRGDRNTLSSRWSIDLKYMKERVKAHELIFQHALKAGIQEDTSEMQHFSRELFLISRQCGKIGLTKESKKMFELSRKAAGEKRAKSWDYIIYDFLASILGWSAIGKIVCFSDRIRK